MQPAVRSLLFNGAGIFVGLFLGVPPAFGAHTIGLPWLPFGLSVVVIGLVTGLLMAFLANGMVAANEPPEKPADAKQDAEPEQEVVWSVLLDLELQDLEERASARVLRPRTNL